MTDNPWRQTYTRTLKVTFLVPSNVANETVWDQFTESMNWGNGDLRIPCSEYVIEYVPYSIEVDPA